MSGSIPKDFAPSKASYTIKSACDYLGMSESTVRRLIERGELRKSKALRKVHLLGEDVETLFARTV